MVSRSSKFDLVGQASVLYLLLESTTIFQFNRNGQLRSVTDSFFFTEGQFTDTSSR